MQPSILHRLFWGLVLVAVGIVFLLNQTGAISIDIRYLFSNFWPVIIIFFGLQGLLLQRAGAFMWNSVVVLVGVILLGRNMGWFSWDLGDLFRLIGPVILILFGINMIFRGSRPRREPGTEDPRTYGWNPVTPPPMPPMPPISPTPPASPFEHQGPPPAPPLSEEPNASFTGTDGADAKPSAGAVPPTRPPLDPWRQRHELREEMRRQRHEFRDEMRRQRHERWNRKHGHHHTWWTCDPNSQQHNRFIGDVHIGHDYWELRPMSISHFIGDTTLDLTKAQIPLGETKIYVSCFIGDVKVYVPNDLGIGVQVVSSSLIGDVKVLDRKQGGLFNQMSVETPGYADTDKRVILVVSSFIGDVRITKVG